VVLPQFWPYGAPPRGQSGRRSKLRSCDSGSLSGMTSSAALTAMVSVIRVTKGNGTLYGDAGLHSTHEEQHTDWIKRWRREKRL
jgi:hypothetical protein